MATGLLGGVAGLGGNYSHCTASPAAAVASHAAPVCSLLAWVSQAAQRDLGLRLERALCTFRPAPMAPLSFAGLSCERTMAARSVRFHLGM